MSKIMPLEVLSSIKDARPSKSIEELFSVIENANPSFSNDFPSDINQGNIIDIADLRKDVVIESSNNEKELIKSNFPKEKSGFLVVSKVIEG